MDEKHQHPLSRDDPEFTNAFAVNKPRKEWPARRTPGDPECLRHHRLICPGLECRGLCSRSGTREYRATSRRTDQSMMSGVFSSALLEERPESRAAVAITLSQAERCELKDRETPGERGQAAGGACNRRATGADDRPESGGETAGSGRTFFTRTVTIPSIMNVRARRGFEQATLSPTRIGGGVRSA